MTLSNGIMYSNQVGDCIFVKIVIYNVPDLVVIDLMVVCNFIIPAKFGLHVFFKTYNIEIW